MSAEHPTVFIHLFVCFCVVSGKRGPKGKTLEPERHSSKDGNNGSVKIHAEKPTAKTKKPAKLPTGINTGQEEPVSSVKKKPAKAKSAIKAGASESTGLRSAKLKKQDEDRKALKKKKPTKEQEHVNEVQNHTEPSPDPAEQLELHSTSTGTRVMMLKITLYVMI